MGKLLTYLLIIFTSSASIFFSPALYSQDTISGGIPAKALREFEKAKTAFNAGNYQEGEKILDDIIAKWPDYPDAYILQGDMFLEDKKADMAVDAYKKALSLKPEYPDIVCNILANTLFYLTRYGEASYYYREFLKYPGISAESRKSIEKKLKISDWRQDAMDHPVPFNPVNLGPSVNTPDDEYVNTLSTDEKSLIFTRKRERKQPANPGFGLYEEDFYITTYKDSAWTRAQPLGYPAGTEGDAGALCISPDGNYLFFTACFRPDGFGSCDLYYCTRQGDSWSAPLNMGVDVNSDLWDSQPCLSPDGKTLYFASNREGGFGSSDIWKTELGPGGKWKKPVNLGSAINTADAEMVPFIHFDNSTLYFSSKGHPGMGGADLFVSKKLDKGGWSTPVNLGYPINTNGDELAIIINASGNQAYISSEQLGGYGKYDIYNFGLYEDVRPQPVTYLKGRVYDSKTEEPLHARFELIDLEKDSLIMESFSDMTDGEFLICIPSGKDYALNVSCPGYLFYSDHFALSGIHPKLNPFIKDVPLESIETGGTIILKNIFYETDKYQLKDESKTELQKLVEFMKNNPGIKIEIGGHTDNVGGEAYNLDLSEKRSGEVRDYLIGKGIAPGRISSHGYGYSKPIDTNDTEAGRANNRRTEIKITSSGG
jgi:flagellar motor protein MotB